MYFRKLDSLAVDAMAQQSLNETLHAFKPGLASGNDESTEVYKSSIEFLKGAFAEAFDLGREYSCVESVLCFDTLRQKGRILENKLLNLSGGFHTHIGAMFSMGLMSAAAGRLDALGIKYELEYLIVTISDFVRYYSFKSFANLNIKTSVLSAGETLYLKTGATSIRGSAEQGFSPVLTKGIDYLNNIGKDKNYVLTGLFLKLISIIDDSGIILNHGTEVLSDTQRRADAISKDYKMVDAESLDIFLRKKHIVPKAAMGMHSLCLFTQKLLNT